MSALESVLGCVGLCRVGFANPTQREGFCGAGLRAVCRVCWVLSRARAGACFSFGLFKGSGKILYARAEKPNKPNTPNTDALKVLIYKGFKCVGFVSGWAFCVGFGFAGEQGDD